MRQLYALGAVLATVTTSACDTLSGGGGRPDPPELLRYRSTIASVQSAADTALLMPLDIAANDSMILIADQAGPDVRRLTDGGEVHSIIGKKGRGPGEFRNIRGVALSAAGEVAVLDAGNRRVTLWGSDGALESEIPLPPGQVGEASFDSEGRLHVGLWGSNGRRGDAITSVFDAAGASLFSYGSYQPSADPFADKFLNQANYAPVQNGRVWVLYLFRGVLELRGPTGQLRRRVQLPPTEGRPADGPFTAKSPDDPNSVMIVRLPVADDVASDASGRAYVVVNQTPKDRPSYSEVLVFDTLGNRVGSQALRHPTRRIAIRGRQLLALGDPHRQQTGIDLYEIGTDRSSRRKPVEQ